MICAKLKPKLLRNLALPAMNEFDLIAHYLQAHAGQRPDVTLGIGDDCALLTPPHNQCIAVTTDTLVENIHFFPDTPVQAIGHKCLAISLSDLAAMGAEPAWVLLSLTLPAANPSWLQSFGQGFFPLLDQYHMQLVGGNMAAGPLSVTTQVMGFIPSNSALLRSGAKPNDSIYVTGCLGDAGLALRCLQNQIQLPEDQLQLVKQRLDFPDPRIQIGLALRGIAHSAIDISDGLAADLEHILVASQVGAQIIVDDLPLSTVMRTINPQLAHELALTAGDDYELCFTLAVEREKELEQICTALGLFCHCIGKIEETSGLRLSYRNGQTATLAKKGYTHF